MCFAAQIKRSLPIIISVHGINPYFDINFQISNTSNLQIFHAIVMQKLRDQREFLDIEKLYFIFLKS